MKLEIANLQALPVPEDGWFISVVSAVQKVVGSVPELSLALVDNKRISEVHQEFLGDDSTTDVISFSLGEDEGEVVVSVEMAASEAQRLGCSLRDELTLYVVHGLLHLVGHDDLDDASRQQMIAKEKEVLAELGIVPRER